jgi:regulator of sigma E protease
VHEFGHFIVAKATGMRVEEFSLGFGPYVVKKRWGETVYGISAVPLGGYVRVTGMHKEEFQQRIEDLREQEAEQAAIRTEQAAKRAGDEGVAQREAVEVREDKKKRRLRDPEDALTGKRALTADEIAATPLERRYYSHPLWHKLLFIVAGVAMNIIVAYVLLYGVGVAKGTDVLPPVVAEVAVGSGAWDAGIKPGDVITSVAGHKISAWDGMAWEVVKHKGETVDISLLRDGVALTLRAQIRADKEGIGKLGVTPKVEYIHKNIGWLGGFGYAGRLVGDTFMRIFQGIGMLFTRDVPATGSQGLMGVVGIVDFSAQVVQGGFSYYLNFLAFISLSLGLMNILPLLPLDGGHVVMSVIERLRGRSVSLKVFERISLVGLALVAVLFVVAMYNDIGRLVTGG